MLTWTELDASLRAATVAMSARHAGEALSEHRSSIMALDARDLVRLQVTARRGRLGVGPLGRAQDWRLTLADGRVEVAAFAALHRDGRLRELAVRRLAVSDDPLATRVLALAAHDHVEVIRTTAQGALVRRTGAADAQLVMPVLVAMRRWRHGAGWLETYVDACSHDPRGARDADLVMSTDAGTRLWVYRRALRSAAPDVDSLARWLRGEREQQARWTLARALLDLDPERVTWLATSTRKDDRFLGLWYLPDDAVPIEIVERYLLSGSPRLREAARWRYARLGGSVEEFHLQRLGELNDQDQDLPFLLAGLRETGHAVEAGLAARLVQHGRAAVRLEALRSWPPPGPENALLLDLLEDPSASVARRAAAMCVGRGLDYESFEQAARSESVIARRCALTGRRNLGDWARVRADLEALEDPDLRGTAFTDLRAWLTDRAPIAYSVPEGLDRVEIMRRLDGASLPAGMERFLRFCIGG